MSAYDAEARPARLHAMNASVEGLTGIAALLQRIVVYEATAPPGAVAGQRVSPRGQPHIVLTLPAGTLPGSVEKFVNMEAIVPHAWEPGVQLMTTLRSGARVRILLPPEATVGQSMEFSVPFSMLTSELQGLLAQLDALQRAVSASPDDAALRGQLERLEGLVQQQLQAQQRPPTPPMGVGVGVGAGAGMGAVDAATLAAAVETAVQRAFQGASAGWLETLRAELRALAAALSAQGRADMEAALEGAIARLLEAQRAAHAAQQAQLDAWLQTALEAIAAAARDSAAAAAAAAGAARQATPPRPSPGTPPPPACATEAVACQVSPLPRGMAVGTQAGGWDAEAQTSSPARAAPAEVAARVVAASAHLAASGVARPRTAAPPDWRWYHQVHATPPGCLAGRYVR